MLPVPQNTAAAAIAETFCVRFHDRLLVLDEVGDPRARVIGWTTWGDVVVQRDDRGWPISAQLDGTCIFDHRPQTGWYVSLDTIREILPEGTGDDAGQRPTEYGQKCSACGAPAQMLFTSQDCSNVGCRTGTSKSAAKMV